MPTVRQGLLLSALLLTAVCVGAAEPANTPGPARELGKHPNGAGCLTFSADGRLLACGGQGSGVEVWEVATGKLLGGKQIVPKQGPSYFVCCVAFSPDGKYLAFCGHSGQRASGPITRWDVAGKRELPALPGPGEGTYQIRFSPDGKYLATAGFDSVLRLWDPVTGKEQRRIPGLGRVTVFAFSPDSRLVATGDPESIRLWDVATGKERFRFPSNRQATTAIAFSADGRLLATGEGNQRVRVWEVVTGQVVMRGEGHGGEISGVAFSPDGRTVFSSSYDSKVRVWDVPSGKQLGTMSEHKGWVWDMALSPDGRTLASAGRDERVLLWDVARVPVPRPSARLSKGGLETRWMELGGDSAPAAFRAVCALAWNPGQAVPLLEDRLAAATRPAGAVPPQRIARLIAELDSDEFAVREAASKELETIGRQAEAALRRAQATGGSPEARRRIGRLLARLRPTRLSRSELYALRGVQVLEYAGTKEAQRLLEKLAEGAAEERLTNEARAALRRLRDPKKR